MVRASTIRGVSASVASFAVIAVTVGVLMWTPWLASGTNRTVMFSLIAFMLPLIVADMLYPRFLMRSMMFAVALLPPLVFYGFNISFWYSVVNPGVSHFAITPGWVVSQLGHDERFAEHRPTFDHVDLPSVLDGLAQPG